MIEKYSNTGTESSVFSVDPGAILCYSTDVVNFFLQAAREY